MKNKLLLMIVMLLLVSSMVNAFGETKDFKKDITTSKYGRIDIKNNFGLPLISKTISSYELLENTDECLIDCKAKLQVTLYEDSKLMDSIKFVSFNKEQKNIKYEITQLIKEEYQVEVKDLKNCKKDVIVFDNITGQSSTQEKDSKCADTSHLEARIRFKEIPINLNTISKGSNEGIIYSIILKGKKLPNENVDWVTTIKGQELKEWTWWNSSWITVINFTNVTNPKGFDLKNYEFNFTINGSALISKGLQSDGRDLRIVRNGTELKWVNFTNFNRNDLNLMINLNMTPNQIIRDVQIYINNSNAVYPYYNKSDIYTLYDDFSVDDLSVKWNQVIGTWSIANGVLSSPDDLSMICAKNVNITSFVFSANMTDPNPYIQMPFLFNGTGTSNVNEGFGWAFDKNNGLVTYYKYDSYITNVRTVLSPYYTNWINSNSISDRYTIEVNRVNYTYMSLNFTQLSSGTKYITPTYNDSVVGNSKSGTLCLSKDALSQVNYSNVEAYQKVYPSPSYNINISLAYGLNTVDVALTNPINHTSFNTNNIKFNATITTVGATFKNITFRSYLKNATLYADNITQFNTLSGNGILNYNWSFNYPESIFWYWNVTLCGQYDTGTVSCVDSPSNSFQIDTTPPLMTLYSPITNYNIISLPVNITLNYTVSDPSLGSCYFTTDFNATTTIFTCNTLTNALFDTSGYHNITFSVNDTFGSTITNTTNFLLNYVVPFVNFTSPILISQNNTFYFNLTANSITQANASINYNGTKYQMPLLFNNSTDASFGVNIQSPSFISNQNVSFNFSYYVNGGLLNTANYYQYVYNLPNLTINQTCNTPSLTFNLVNEENLTDVAGNYQYNFYYGLTNNTLVRNFGTINNTNSFSICANTTLSSIFYLGSGEIFYTANNGNYVNRRYYTFSNMSMTNVTTNITLHDLLNSAQTSFQLEVESSDLTPYIGVITSLMRWYPNLNQYRTVDVGKTDELGNTVIHVVSEDVDYRIAVYYLNGTLIKLANPIRMVCVATPCTYTLRISPEDFDLTSFLNMQYTFSYNYTTGIWLFTYSDPSLKVDTINLTIYKDTATTNVQVCNSLTTGVTGVLTCNTSGQTGHLRGQVTRTASPTTIIVQKIIDLTTSPFTSSWGLFVSLLIAVLIAFFLSFVNPIAAIIGGVLALIPAFIFGAINFMVLGGFIVLMFIIIHFTRKVG